MDSEGNAEISRFKSGISGDVEIPEKSDDHPVTSIGFEAFAECDSITSITFPDSVTEINVPGIQRIHLAYKHRC